MIRPRAHLATLTRPGQQWETRAGYLRLDLNELVPQIDEQVAAAIMDQIQPWHLTAYPEVNNVYRAIAAASGLSEDHVILTSGSDAGIRQVIEAFCDPGDAIMITYPTYGMYEVYAHIFDLECIKLCYDRDFNLDISQLAGHITPQTKVIAIANPNGAIGCAMPVADLEHLLALASQYGAVVLLDEAYTHFHGDDWVSRVDTFDNLILVRTFSKAGGMAGLRFGYILTNPTIREWLFKVKPVVEINSVAAIAGAYLLNHPQILRRAVQACLDGKEHLVQTLRAWRFVVYPGHANFVQVKFGSHKATIYESLQQRRILVKDQSGSDILGSYTRITIGPRAQMDQLLDAIRAGMVENPAHQ